MKTLIGIVVVVLAAFLLAVWIIPEIPDWLGIKKEGGEKWFLSSVSDEDATALVERYFADANNGLAENAYKVSQQERVLVQQEKDLRNDQDLFAMRKAELRRQRIMLAASQPGGTITANDGRTYSYKEFEADAAERLAVCEDLTERIAIQTELISEQQRLHAEGSQIQKESEATLKKEFNEFQRKKKRLGYMRAAAEFVRNFQTTEPWKPDTKLAKALTSFNDRYDRLEWTVKNRSRVTLGGGLIDLNGGSPNTISRIDAFLDEGSQTAGSQPKVDAPVEQSSNRSLIDLDALREEAVQAD